MQTFELPIFPLNTVLFPGGVLPLKIFEQRYMTMAKECLNQQTHFGVCLIAEGAEVGAPATPHLVGTSALITEWDMPQLGVLEVTTRGGQRFRVLKSEVDRQGLLRAKAAWIQPEAGKEVPEHLHGLLPLLRAIVMDMGTVRIPEPHAFDDATWVGYRYAEVLPIPFGARQKLLELDDPVSRLEIIFEFLSQRRLVS